MIFLKKKLSLIFEVVHWKDDNNNQAISLSGVNHMYQTTPRCSIKNYVFL